MPQVEDILSQMRRNPKDVRFLDPCKVCAQVKQVLNAIQRLENTDDTQE